jgi:hypothetical protein
MSSHRYGFFSTGQREMIHEQKMGYKMKNLKNYAAVFSVLAALSLTSCGKDGGQSQGSGSSSETTPNDSSGATSRSALGVDEGQQRDKLGYPSNQSNLNSDSTSRLHDDNDVVGKPQEEKMKDKPNKHVHQ